MNARSAGRNRPESGSVGYNLLGIAVIVLLVGVAFAYAVDAASAGIKGASTAAREDLTVTRTLAGRAFLIPANWLSNPDQGAEGFAKRIDLRVSVPLGQDGALRNISVTLLPRSAIRPSAKLLDGVYLHMFQPAEMNGPRGLVGKPLRPTAGYEDETVWYDPLSTDPFVAKCGAPVRPGQQARCLRAVHLGEGIAAVYAFDFDVLLNWRRFDAELKPLLAELGALEP